MKICILLFGLLICGMAYAQTYDLPNNDADCPANCRQVPWLAGSDIWNGGTLPTYTQDAACAGLVEGNGTTNNAAAINACLSAAASGHAVYIPPGIYYVNSTINIPSNKVLRGAKASISPYLPTADATATTFKLGGSGSVNFGSGSNGSNIAISSGYTKGSTQIVMASGSWSVGAFIIVSENADTAIPVTKVGDDAQPSGCTWCGENDGVHLMAQIVQITAVTGGTTLTLNRPLYYTFLSNLSPVARTVSMSVTKAGMENIRLDGSYADHGNFIMMSNTSYSWLKGVETYMSGSGSQSKPYHVTLQWSYGDEIRDSYFHHSRDTTSDKGYGIAILFSNSDHKIENNILRLNRHSTDMEGGGSGVAVLYNYVDDNYESDSSGWMGSARINHGAHPYMNLYEGNIYSYIVADNIWGSSSHNVFLRNYIWGNETQTDDLPTGRPTGPFQLISVMHNQNYYSWVGNVLGKTGLWGTPSWSSTRNASCGNGWDSGTVYFYGCDTNGDAYNALTSTSSINHGNWDIRTNGVAYWEGGANHTLKNSMYYAAKPAFFGTCSWPAFGSDLTPMTKTLPAQDRFLNGGICSGAISGQPNPPTNLTVIVH